MLPFQCHVIMVVVVLSIGTEGYEMCEDKDVCVIRFYERQYFNGAYWTLDSAGVWKNSRPTSRVKFPYHNFHVKSIRSFCAIKCSWQICPAKKRRKYTRVSRKKHCKILNGNESLESLRRWGSSNSWVLGSVRRINPSKSPKNILNDEPPTTASATVISLASTKSSTVSTNVWDTSTLIFTSPNTTTKIGQDQRTDKDDSPTTYSDEITSLTMNPETNEATNESDNTTTREIETVQILVENPIQKQNTNTNRSVKSQTEKVNQQNLSVMESSGHVIESSDTIIFSTTSQVLQENNTTKHTVRQQNERWNLTTISSDVEISRRIPNDGNENSELESFDTSVIKTRESPELDHTRNAKTSTLTSTEIFSTTVPNLHSSQKGNSQRASEDIVNGNLLLGSQNTASSGSRSEQKRVRNFTFSHLEGTNKNAVTANNKTRTHLNDESTESTSENTSTEKTTTDPVIFSTNAEQSSTLDDVSLAKTNREAEDISTIHPELIQNETDSDIFAVNPDRTPSTIFNSANTVENITRLKDSTYPFISTPSISVEDRTVSDEIITSRTISEELPENTLQKPLIPHEDIIEKEDQVYDDVICGIVAMDPSNYVLPHPKDCTKFFMCQFLGKSLLWKGSWKAHLMQCPPLTGFEERHRICNWMINLPRCQN